MRLRRGFRGLIVALGLLLFSSVPAAVSAANPSPQPDPRKVITRLGDQPPAGPAAGLAPSVPQSFRFTAQGRITVPGESGELSLAINGEFALPDKMHLTLSVTLKEGASNDTVGPLELIVIGKTPYIHLTGDLSPSGKDIWVLVDNPGGAGTFPTTVLPDLGKLPPVSTQTQTLGDETINGTLTTHTRTTVDATALFSGGVKNAKPSTLTVDVWAGKSDNFPRRVGINGNLTIDPAALATMIGEDMAVPSGQPVTLTLAMTMDFTDLNAPVTINAPTTFVKLSDVVK